MSGGPRSYAVRFAAAATVAMLGPGAGAHAQVAQPEAVKDLVSPAAEPEQSGLGARFGSFILSPSLDVGEEFENNVFSTNSDTHSDFVTVVRPAFDLVSDWNVHAIALHAEGDVRQYSKFSGENAGDVIVSGQGRLDISNGQYFMVNAGYQNLQEPRSSPDSIEAVRLAGGTIASQPTPFTILSGDFRYIYSPGLIKLELDGSVFDYEFTNTPTVGGGEAINSDRNRAEYTVTPKIGYEFWPGYQVYVQASGDSRQYDSKFDATPERLERDSTGYATAVGVDFAASALLTGTFFAGYQSQFYEDPRLSTIQGAYFGGSLTWTATNSTAIKVSLSRQILETIVIGSSGFWDTQLSLNVDQVLFEGLHVNGSFSYNDSDYKGLVLTDNQYDAKAGLIWTINRYLDLDASAEWLHQSSSQPLGGFDQEIVQLGVKVRL